MNIINRLKYVNVPKLIVCTILATIFLAIAAACTLVLSTLIGGI